jgi:large subunit ribosomal protein L23
MAKAIHPYDVLRRPIITEKSTALAAFGKYVFEVDTRANKPQIRDAVQRAFDVTVTSVNTCMVRGKTKRTGRRVGQQSSWKKAIVTVVPGDEIELFEGV